jgi:hypothetical protein
MLCDSPLHFERIVLLVGELVWYAGWDDGGAAGGPEEGRHHDGQHTHTEEDAALTTEPGTRLYCTVYIVCTVYSRIDNRVRRVGGGG